MMMIRNEKYYALANAIIIVRHQTHMHYITFLNLTINIIGFKKTGSQFNVTVTHARCFLHLIADVYFSELFKKAEQRQFEFIAAALRKSRVCQVDQPEHSGRKSQHIRHE